MWWLQKFSFLYINVTISHGFIQIHIIWMATELFEFDWISMRHQLQMLRLPNVLSICQRCSFNFVVSKKRKKKNIRAAQLKLTVFFFSNCEPFSNASVALLVSTSQANCWFERFCMQIRIHLDLVNRIECSNCRHKVNVQQWFPMSLRILGSHSAVDNCRFV